MTGPRPTPAQPGTGRGAARLRDEAIRLLSAALEAAPQSAPQVDSFAFPSARGVRFRTKTGEVVTITSADAHSARSPYGPQFPPQYRIDIEHGGDKDATYRTTCIQHVNAGIGPVGVIRQNRATGVRDSKHRAIDYPFVQALAQRYLQVARYLEPGPVDVARLPRVAARTVGWIDTAPRAL